MTALRANLRNVWRRLSRVELVALVLLVVGLISELGGSGGVWSFLKFLGVLAAIYLIVRLVGWWRTRLLWRLRNRLIVAYLFIAVVPVLLLLILAVFAGQILYSQLGAYLIYEDIHGRLAMIDNSAENIAAAESTLPASIPEPVLEQALDAQARVAHGRDLPGLKIDFHRDPAYLHRIAGPEAKSFTGIVQAGNQIWLTALKQTHSQRGTSVVELSVRVTPEFLETVAEDLGPIQVIPAERVGPDDTRDAIPIGNAMYRFMNRIATRHRALQAPGFWVDPAIDGLSKLEATYLQEGGRTDHKHPVFASFTARPSQLNQRIFSSLGELSRGKVLWFLLEVIGFLLIEIAALVTGIVLTRAITSAVAELDDATQFVQAGDFTHRVRIERRDQLGVLGESFNKMTDSISGLIEEQKKRQRLENEISIAREVQNQLFPQSLPVVPGVEAEAICKAARTVSGDYYDFIQLSPTHLAIAIADISGKGISAALLMASLQAALRSQLLAPGSETLSMAELVTRLNLHMVRNTADDRFATFFIAVYDSATRLLRYTNAGHLPGLLICHGAATHLTEGGMVLGVVEDYEYVEGRLNVPQDSVLVTYSDGLVEPENVYGEEFGVKRLQEAAIRVQNATPMMVGEALMLAAEEWAGTPEQADDMTVVVARLR